MGESRAANRRAAPAGKSAVAPSGIESWRLAAFTWALPSCPKPLDELAARATRVRRRHGRRRPDRRAARASCKEAMADLRARHDAGASGLEIEHGRSAIIDALISGSSTMRSACHAGQQGPTPAAVSLIALGGYGRGELAPWSDIDVMFLYPTKSKPAVVEPFQAHLTQEVLYPLWDCGLKVGHSTRTVEEVFAQAEKEIMTMTVAPRGALRRRAPPPCATRSSSPTGISTRRTTPRATSSPGSRTRPSAARSTETPSSTRNPTSRTASGACAITRTPSGWRG